MTASEFATILLLFVAVIAGVLALGYFFTGHRSRVLLDAVAWMAFALAALALAVAIDGTNYLNR